MALADDNGDSRDDQEEALVALIEHRTKEVEHIRKRIAYYQAQLDEAERRLDDSQIKLVRLRSQANVMSSKNSKGDGFKSIKVERRSPSPIQISEDSASPPHQAHSKPKLVIPAANVKKYQAMKPSEPSPKASTLSGSRSSTSPSTHVNSIVKAKGEKSYRITSEQETMEVEAKGTKRKLVQKEGIDLIPLISTRSSPRKIICETGSLIPSQHKRKLRSLVLCPTNDKLFVTSALDGVVNLWQVEGRGSSATLLSSSDCASLKQRRWPEDMAWHPRGKSLFSVYSADGGDSQISVLDLNQKFERTPASFLKDKPHVKGIINSIVFMPWADTYFVTGGSDHAVVIWTEKDEENSWKPKLLHKSVHSSAVMGVAGVHHKQTVMSAGADKRIIGFDLLAERADYKHQIESKCMSVLPNPCDFNLVMVQTGSPERQLRLFDIRLKQDEIHAFGWKQESSESQSALINQAWSPDGLYITSGSADPMIHIFDIRFNAHNPSQSIRAHQKRVFKAVWHHTLPLLISISSDLNIGLHKFT
ncbi:hypothetical protein LguiB_023044 [Lonicera macranthoides]